MTAKRCSALGAAMVITLAFLAVSCPTIIEEARRWEPGPWPPGQWHETDPSPMGWGAPDRKGQWELVWRDEFTGTELDRAKWNIDTGTGAQFGLAGWGNQELQYYTESENNLRVQDGMLVIEVRNDGRTGSWWQHGGGGQMVQSHRPFTSAKVTTGGTRSSNTYCTLHPDCIGRHDCTGCVLPERFSISEGFIEARIRAPRGVGFWPAFWTLGTNTNRYGNGGPGAHVGWPSSGEIDIMEMQGGREFMHISTIHHGVRYPAQRWYSGRFIDVRSVLPQGVDMANGFHVYGVRWDENTMHFYFNGLNWFTIDLNRLQGGQYANAESFTAPTGQFINLNLAVGGNFISNIPPAASLFAPGSPWENRSLMVDWVRVYRRVGGNSIVRINGEVVP